MKKHKLVPVALAALTLSGLAAAQGGSSVQIYGQIGAAVNEQSHQGAGQGSSLYTAGNNEFAVSLIGLRGTEDLGDGMKAIFRLETGLNTDTGTQTVNGTQTTAGGGNKLWNRQSYVGLNFGEFGEVTLGRQFTAATDRMVRTLDIFNVAGQGARNTPFALFGVNKYAAAAANTTNNLTQVSFDNRSDDTVKYRINGPDGLQAGASFGFNDGEGQNYSLDVGQGNAYYQVGALWVRFKAPFTFSGYTPVQDTWAIGGNVAVGPVRVYATYFENRADGATAALVGKPKQDNKIVELGARWSVFAALDLSAVIYHDKGTAMDNVVGRNGTKNTWVALADYYVSKRTTLNFGVINNSLESGYQLDPTNASLLFGRTSLAGTPTSTMEVTGGIRHVF